MMESMITMNVYNDNFEAELRPGRVALVNAVKPRFCVATRGAGQEPAAVGEQS